MLDTCVHICIYIYIHLHGVSPPVRKHPIVLPHKLVSHCSWPTVDAGDVKQYWQHLTARGSPLSQLSPDQDHIPVWLWGDEAQYRKGSQDEILLLCMGSVLHPEKFSVASCFPLTICRSDSWMLSLACLYSVLRQCLVNVYATFSVAQINWWLRKWKLDLPHFMECCTQYLWSIGQQ